MLRCATWVVVLGVVGCSDGDRGRSRVTQAVTSQPDRILVLFTDPGGELPGRTRAIAQRRDDILAALPPRSFVLTRAYLTLPGFAGIARPEALDALHSDPRVTSIEVDAPTQTLLAQSSALVHAVSARATHSVTGAGVTVAVLDTGVAAAHPDLASSIVAE